MVVVGVLGVVGVLRVVVGVLEVVYGYLRVVQVLT